VRKEGSVYSRVSDSVALNFLQSVKIEIPAMIVKSAKERIHLVAKDRIHFFDPAELMKDVYEIQKLSFYNIADSDKIV